MEQLKVYITLEVPEDFFRNYSKNMEKIELGVQCIADDIEGDVLDLEIK